MGADLLRLRSESGSGQLTVYSRRRGNGRDVPWPPYTKSPTSDSARIRSVQVSSFSITSDSKRRANLL